MKTIIMRASPATIAAVRRARRGSNDSNQQSAAGENQRQAKVSEGSEGEIAHVAERKGVHVRVLSQRVRDISVDWRVRIVGKKKDDGAELMPRIAVRMMRAARGYLSREARSLPSSMASAG